MTLEHFSEISLACAARAAELHATDARNQLALFSWNTAAQLFEIEVCGLIVATAKTYQAVRAFCDMHHAGFSSARP